MNMLRIALGSTRRPKVNAVREAAAVFAPQFQPPTACEINGYQVESGVSLTPISRRELMQGARQRAEALKDKLCGTGDPADFYVGLEGGLDVVEEDGHRLVFLESWAYVSDARSGHFGSSGSIEIPLALAEEVLSQGTELARAIDEFAGAVGIRDGQGAWGVLSGNLITRQDSFRTAVLAAFAPFFNSKMYRSVSAPAG